MAKEINTAILKLRKRSEKYSTEQLVNTFVDVGSLFTQLMNNDHQILYGRRGTGKTHVLKYLCSKIENEGSYPIYIDLRLVGSTGGLYSDRTIPVSERATRLLIDVFSVIHDQIFEFIAEDNREDVHMGTMGPLLEELATSISEIKISGEITKENLVESNIKNSNNVALTLGTAPNIGFTKDCCIGEKIGEKTVNTGFENHRVHFPSIRVIMSKILNLIAPHEFWIVLDEWAEIPVELQPFLGDLLRRCLFPIYGVTVKIGAIEQRALKKPSLPF